MRFLPGAALAGALAACAPTPSGYTLLFLDRSPAARIGALSWAPDAARSRLIAVDGDLRAARALTHPRLAAPVAVQRLGDRLLVTERTGEGVVFDTAGTFVREWESPFPTSLFATGGDRIVAVRSPYLVEFVAEDGTQPLMWLLDSLGRTARGLGTTRIPENRYGAQRENAGAVALDRSGGIYFAPLAREEIARLDAAGEPEWRVSRAGVTLALALGPDGLLYALAAADSGTAVLRLDVLDPRNGRLITTHDIPGPRAAVAVDRRGRVRILDADSLLGRAPLQRSPASPSL